MQTAHNELSTVPDEVVTTVDEDIQAKILALLEVYPYVSRSMIQTGLGPALPPKLWDPILKALVDTEQVCFREVTAASIPTGRSLTKGIYHLPKFPYPPHCD